jgi:hypothetical protein
MNPPSIAYAMLQVMVIVLIFLSVFLALFLCMILCLVAVEFSCAGVSFIWKRKLMIGRGSSGTEIKMPV